MKTFIFHISFLGLIVLFPDFSFSQFFRKTYLSIESENFKKDHIIKEDKLVRIWIDPSTSYFGFLEFGDSLTLAVNDTLIHPSDVFQIQARNNRRSIGAVFTLVSPVVCGIIVDGILYFSDVYGSFTFIPATRAGIAGSVVGFVVVCFTMNRRIYKMSDGVELKIYSKN